MAFSDADLEEILDRWEQGRLMGVEVSIDELCQERPGLAEHVREAIAKLLAMDAALDTVGMTAESGAADTLAQALPWDGWEDYELVFSARRPPVHQFGRRHRCELAGGLGLE